MTKEVFEKVSPAERISSLNEIKIEFDEESFYHINHSHFAPSTKTVNSNKSFFTNQNIDYRKLYLEVKGIISRIETSGKYKGEAIRKVSIVYKGENYQLWINVNKRKDDGQTRFNQVGSFYPITDKEELQGLAINYYPVKVDEELYVYVRNCKKKFKDWFKQSTLATQMKSYSLKHKVWKRK